jgi:hypothetical protein
MEKITMTKYLLDNKIKFKNRYLKINDGELRTPSEWETFINENKTW